LKRRGHGRTAATAKLLAVWDVVPVRTIRHNAPYQRTDAATGPTGARPLEISPLNGAKHY